MMTRRDENQLLVRSLQLISRPVDDNRPQWGSLSENFSLVASSVGYCNPILGTFGKAKDSKL
jgi:hypothetical protein